MVFNIFDAFKNTEFNFGYDLESTLQADINALEAFKEALNNNMSPLEAYANCFRNASKFAKDYAESIDIAKFSADDYSVALRKNQVSLLAQDKSFKNIRSLIDGYNKGIETTELYTNEFADAVLQSNKSLGQYLIGLNGAKASTMGYIGTLIKSKAAALAAQAAQMALSAAISMGISFVISKAISFITDYIAKQSELRKQAIETGEAAKEEAEALSTLYNEYKSAKAAYDTNTGSKEQLDSATQSLLDSLGIEESQIDGLITKYGSLSAAIQQVSIEKLKTSRDDLTAGLEAATEELLAKTEDGWLSGDFGTIKFSLANGAYGEDPFADVLEAAGYKISSEFSNFGGYQGSFIDVGENNTLEEDLALYQELLNMQAKLSEGVDSGDYTREELLESPVYKAINDKIAEFETEVESVQSFIDEINSTSAQIIHMEFSAANGLPETQEQFESYKQTLINTAMSSGQFIGSQEAIEASIIDMLATLPEMSKFMSDYANELASEKPTFKSFSEIIWDDPEDDKDAIDTLNKYLDQVKQLDDALAKISSGDFSANDFYELANSFPDLYHLVEETGSWEAAINAVRASIVGVKGESKDATTVFGLMSTMFQGMDFANEENFASWVQFWQTVEDSVSTGEKAALTFNSMSDAMKGIGDAASFAAQAQEELATDGVNSLDTLQSLIGTFGTEAASSMYKVTTKGVIVDVEKVKEAYVNAISEINGLSIQESAALDELWDMEFDKAEFDAFVDSMGKVEKAAGFVADAQKEIGENGHNSFETLTELYDLLGEDANKYISYADGKPIIDLEGVKQEYFAMIDEMEQATPELKQIMKDTFEFELEESSFDTLIDNYIADAQTLQDALKKVQEDGLEPIDMYKLMDEFPELKGKSEDLEGAIIDLLGSMDADVIAAFNEQFGKCDSEEDRKELEDFMEVVLAVGKVVGETQFAIDINAEAEGMDNLFTAIKESVSSTGLAAESIENLKKRYASLSGVDVSSLFERTENGIHLNTKALRELESEYEKVTKTALDTKLNDLVDQYNKLTEQIDNAGIAASTVDLYAQRNDILQQINETADLASQYAGLTSAFYKWEQAQSMGEEGDMYDSLTGGLENVKQLYEDGLVGTNKFRTAVQLMSNEDLSNATAAELIDAYEAGYPKMQRYFQDSSDGVLNFLHDVQDLNSEWAHLNEDGSWDIDFGVGGDQEIADALGINVEAVQSILRKLSDYGFDINLDMQYSDLDTVQTKAEKAAETLKKLGATDYQFNFGATNIDRVEEQITEAEKALDKFRNKDGSVNLDLEGAEEAQYILAALVLQKQSLESPTILSIDAGNIDGAVGETLRKLQQIKTSYNNMQLQAAIGADTSQIQSEINSTISSLTTEELEIAAQLGIDTTTSLETLNSQISEITPEMLLTVGVNQEAVTAFMESSHDTSANVTYNVRDHRVRAYKAPGKTGNVTYEADMIAWEPPTKYGKIVYTATYSSPSKGETNRGQGVAGAASGTAYAQGDWSTKRSGTALGGELGREIVVRNGKYFTIGDYGAEFFQYKKGDIIFNHKQTEQLLKNGKISGITPRGKALAEGTAFSGGNGTITGSGSVITKPSSGSTSNKGSSSSSSDEESDPSIKDWIEVAISRIQRLVEKAANAFASIFKPLPKRLEAATEQMRKMREELAIQEAGFERYMQEANSVGLSDELKKKVHDGTIDIKEYDEETAELIDSYTEW